MKWRINILKRKRKREILVVLKEISIVKNYKDLINITKTITTHPLLITIIITITITLTIIITITIIIIIIIIIIITIIKTMKNN
jgi:hypothetical protein